MRHHRGESERRTNLEMTDWMSVARTDWKSELREVGQRRIGIAELVHFDSHAVHDGEVKTAEFAVFVFAVVEHAVAFDGAAAAAGKEDGELLGIVSVAVPKAGAKHDHAVVEEGTLAFVGAVHFLQGLGEQLHVVLIDALIHVEALGIIGVVGEFVLAAFDVAKEAEVHAGQVVVEHHGGDAGAVHLKREDHDVELELEVIAHIGGDAGFGSGKGGGGDGGLPAVAVGVGFAKLVGFLDALFEFADRGKIFVELVGVAAADLATQAVGIAEDGVEHAFVAASFGAVVEELVEGLLGIDFLRGRGGGAAPGDVGGVDGGESAVGAVAWAFGA